MPSNSYTITEPHPTVPQYTYTHSGRGGAGNMFRVDTVVTPPTGVPTTVSTPPAPAAAAGTSSSSSSKKKSSFHSGRGGAGNAHASSERPGMSFDEELRRAEVLDRAAAVAGANVHVGRGGAGNVYERKNSNSSSRSDRGSVSSGGSARSGWFRRS